MEYSRISSLSWQLLHTKQVQLEAETIDAEPYSGIFDQVLSTFKFTDQQYIFCGGIAGISCPSGYTCKLDGNYPDAGGTCVVPQNGTLKATVMRSPTCAGAQRPGEICSAPVAMKRLRSDLSELPTMKLFKPSLPTKKENLQSR